MEKRTAIIAGASGLVGGHLLRRLLDEPAYRAVISLGRRALAIQHDKLRQETVDFAALDRLQPFPRADDVFCCLGTAINKAGSQSAFRAVDHDAVVNLARAAHAAGARQFLHVSSLGASARAPVFYNRVKGETEDDVVRIGYARALAFRPSILDGDRAESRPGEKLGLAVARRLGPLLGKYRPTHADAVAAAMIAEALRGGQGAGVVESRQIEAIAGR